MAAEITNIAASLLLEKNEGYILNQTPMVRQIYLPRVKICPAHPAVDKARTAITKSMAWSDPALFWWFCDCFHHFSLSRYYFKQQILIMCIVQQRWKSSRPSHAKFWHPVKKTPYLEEWHRFSPFIQICNKVKKLLPWPQQHYCTNHF